VQVTFKLTGEDWIVVYTRWGIDATRRRCPMGLGQVVRLLLSAGAVILLFPGSIVIFVIANAWLASLVDSTSERFLLNLIITVAFAELVLLTCCVVGHYWRKSQRGPWIGMFLAKRWLEPAAQRAAMRVVRHAIEEGTISLGWRYQLSVDASGISEVADLDEGETIRRSETRVAWPAIEQIDATGRYVLLSAGKMRSFLVPSQAFPNHVAFREFVEYVRQLWSSPSETGITATLPIPTSGAREIQAGLPKTI
jgi:hypothetical protein